MSMPARTRERITLVVCSMVERAAPKSTKANSIANSDVTSPYCAKELTRRAVGQGDGQPGGEGGQEAVPAHGISGSVGQQHNGYAGKGLVLRANAEPRVHPFHQQGTEGRRCPLRWQGPL